MLAGSAQTYLNRYGIRIGDNPAVLTSHDSAWYAAFDLADAGSKIAAIIDTRDKVRSDLRDAAEARGIKVLTSHTATATAGRRRVRSVRVNPLRDGKVGAGREIACDALLMSGGWTPSLHLFSHTKGSVAWDADIRLGSSAGTTRGFGEAEFRRIGELILQVIDGLAENPDGGADAVAAVRAEVQALCRAHPIYEPAG